MDFAEETKRLRLRSIHPGVPESEVQKQTGFALATSTGVTGTEPPTDEELQVLRTRVDLTGFLRRS
jgi:glutaconate CoA-transferase subunit B